MYLQGQWVAAWQDRSARVAAPQQGGRKDAGMVSGSIAALVLRLVVGGTMMAHGWNHAFGGGKLLLATCWRPHPGPAASASADASRPSAQSSTPAS